MILYGLLIVYNAGIKTGNIFEIHIFEILIFEILKKNDNFRLKHNYKHE